MQAAGEQVVVRRSAANLIEASMASRVLRRDLELNRLLCFLLEHNRLRRYPIAVVYITDGGPGQDQAPRLSGRFRPEADAAR